MTDRGYIIAVIVWPFIFLAPYTLNSIGIGNDFGYLYYIYKVYLLSIWNSGHFPLWSPTEGAGYPFFSNPFAQPFYPLNLLYFAYFKLFGHFSPWDYQVFTMLGISIFGVGLFCWLRRLTVTAPVALVTVVISVISLKVTELLRLPNALHCAAWIPWLLYGATIATDSRKIKSGSMLFGAALVMLLTAGYPYYIIYALFLIPAYVAAMAFNPSRNLFIGASYESPSCFSRYAIHLGGATVCAGILTSPWLFHMQKLMAQTVDRDTPNFQYATSYKFGPLQTLGSWIFPPSSNMEGWYYFGIAATLLIGFFAISIQANFAVALRQRRLFITIAAWLVFINYLSWSGESALFTWAWHHLPVLNQMRAWGRMNIIQVPILALLLAMAIGHFAHIVSNLQLMSSRKGAWMIVALLGLVLTILYIQWDLIAHGAFDEYWTDRFKRAEPLFVDRDNLEVTLKEKFDERFFLVTCVATGTVLVGFLLAARRQFSAELAPTFLRYMVILSVAEMFVISNYQWTTPSAHHAEGILDIPKLLASEFSSPRALSSPLIMASGATNYNVGLYRNWGFKRHTDNYLRYLKYNGEWQPEVSLSERAAVERFYGADQKAQRIFFSARVDHGSVIDFLQDVDATEPLARPSVRIEHYNGDELRLSVNLRRSCWLTFVDNWDPNWRAKVNNVPAPIALTLGSYKAVLLPVGQAEVEFQYRPPIIP
jgi:hypothetical protein